MGFVYFDKRAFAFLIKPVAPWQITQFIIPVIEMLRCPTLNRMLTRACLCVPQVLVYDCVRAVRAER